MLNNKGQSLILFVIVLPILLFILILVIDIGKIIVLKQELNNINEIVLDYGLDKLYSNDEEIYNFVLEDDLRDLVDLNNESIDVVSIEIDNNKIYINLEESVNGVFSSFMNISIFNVKSYYVGYIENNKKKIEIVGD